MQVAYEYFNCKPHSLLPDVGQVCFDTPDKVVSISLLRACAIITNLTRFPGVVFMN